MPLVHIKIATTNGYVLTCDLTNETIEARLRREGLPTVELLRSLRTLFPHMGARIAVHNKAVMIPATAGLVENLVLTLLAISEQQDEQPDFTITVRFEDNKGHYVFEKPANTNHWQLLPPEYLHDGRRLRAVGNRVVRSAVLSEPTIQTKPRVHFCVKPCGNVLTPLFEIVERIEDTVN